MKTSNEAVDGKLNIDLKKIVNDLKALERDLQLRDPYQIQYELLEFTRNYRKFIESFETTGMYTFSNKEDLK